MKAKTFSMITLPAAMIFAISGCDREKEEKIVFLDLGLEARGYT